MGLADWFRRRGADEHADDEPPEPDDDEREGDEGDEGDEEDPTVYPLW
jgi:hypothetical protein